MKSVVRVDLSIKALSMHIQKPFRITKGFNSHRIAPQPLHFIISIFFCRYECEIPSITLQDIKETKRYRLTERRTSSWDGHYVASPHLHYENLATQFIFATHEPDLRSLTE